MPEVEARCHFCVNECVLRLHCDEQGIVVKVERARDHRKNVHPSVLEAGCANWKPLYGVDEVTARSILDHPWGSREVMCIVRG
jgi:hypothetical protein